jgi:hypothetical protein
MLIPWCDFDSLCTYQPIASTYHNYQKGEEKGSLALSIIYRYVCVYIYIYTLHNMALVNVYF